MQFALSIVRYYAGWSDKFQGKTCPAGKWKSIRYEQARAQKKITPPDKSAD